jgi:hypothetical protein
MLQPTQSLSRTASWVIREKTTKKVVLETFNAQLVELLNTAKYEAVPILEYLQEVNRIARAQMEALRAVSRGPVKLADLAAERQAA